MCIILSHLNCTVLVLFHFSRCSFIWQGIPKPAMHKVLQALEEQRPKWINTQLQKAQQLCSHRWDVKVLAFWPEVFRNAIAIPQFQKIYPIFQLVLFSDHSFFSVNNCIHWSITRLRLKGLVGLIKEEVQTDQSDWWRLQLNEIQYRNWMKQCKRIPLLIDFLMEQCWYIVSFRTFFSGKPFE